MLNINLLTRIKYFLLYFKININLHKIHIFKKFILFLSNNSISIDVE